MKHRNIFVLALALLACTACDKHDFIDDLVITGDIDPNLIGWSRVRW